MRGRRSFAASEFGGALPRAADASWLSQPSLYDLPSGLTYTAEDVLLTQGGSLLGRSGDVYVGAFPPGQSVTSGFAYPDAEQILWGNQTLGVIYRIAVLTGALSTISLAAPSGQPWAFARGPVSGGQGPIFAVNSSVAVWIDSGSAAPWTASAGTLPLASYLVSAGNRMFAARMTAYGGLADPGSALVFSELGDPRNWPAANVVQFDPGDGQWITGLGRVGDYLVVFKGRKTWIVYDLDTGANRQLSDEIGCAEAQSIVSTPQGLAFTTFDRGIQVTDGVSIRQLGDVDTTPWFKAPYNAGGSAVMWEGRYVISSGGGLRIYDFRRKAWTTVPLTYENLVAYDDPQGPEQLWGTGNGPGADLGYGRIMAPFTYDGGGVTEIPVTTDWNGNEIVGRYDAVVNVDDSIPHRWQEVHAVGSGNIAFTLHDPTTDATISSAAATLRRPGTDSATAIVKDVRGTHRALVARLSVPSHAEINALTAYTTLRRPG